MTADRKHKKATRAAAAAAGVSYLAARRAQAEPGAGAPSARTVTLEVAELLRAQGWPVVIERVPQFGQRHLYAGPLRVAVNDPGIDPDQDPPFDEDLLDDPAGDDLSVYYEDPAWLAYQLDGLLDTDLAAPAGWAAVAALLAAGAGDGLHERLERAWHQAGTLFTPVERWVDPDHNWIWLPRPARRPGWMVGLGPGARPSALVDALRSFVPGLHEQFVAELQRDYLDQIEEIDDDSDDESEPAPDAETLALGWRAAVSYAVALSTDTADHLERRDPWHAMESFDSLGAHLEALGGQRADLLLLAMIHAGVTVLRAHDAVITS